MEPARADLPKLHSAEVQFGSKLPPKTQ